VSPEPEEKVQSPAVEAKAILAAIVKELIAASALIPTGDWPTGFVVVEALKPLRIESSKVADRIKHVAEDHAARVSAQKEAEAAAKKAAKEAKE
jgi:hypothetical protein